MEKKQRELNRCTTDLDFIYIVRSPATEKKQRELSRRTIDLVFIISYLVMLSGIVVAILGDTHYHSNIVIAIGTVILVLGAIIFSIIYKIDDEPRCFGGIDA